MIATGHYARIVELKTENGVRYTLASPADEKKDQTYMLYRLPQNILAKTIFPLADMNKTDVRQNSRESGLSAADRGDSQEICFLPNGGYTDFVESKKGKLNTLKEIIPVVMYAVPFIGLLFAQPDLGTALVFCCIIGGMLFTAGLSIKLIKRVAIIGVISLPIMYMMMAPHQKERIEAFLHPDDPTLKGNYQVCNL